MITIRRNDTRTIAAIKAATTRIETDTTHVEVVNHAYVWEKLAENPHARLYDMGDGRYWVRIHHELGWTVFAGGAR